MKRTAYFISRMFFYAFSMFLVFVLIFSVLAFTEHYFGWDIPFVELNNQNGNNYATIKIPLTDLKVEFVFTLLVTVVMWIGFLFYAIYFYALKEFFNVFIVENAFNPKAIKKLNLFLWLNLIVVFYGFIWGLIDLLKNKKFYFDEAHFLFIIHGLVALIVYLYLDVFKKGQKIQEENDLTI